MIIKDYYQATVLNFLNISDQFTSTKMPDQWAIVKSCKDPASFVISFLCDIITTLPAILLNISQTPIGLKPGFLSNGINLLAVKAPRDCADCSSSEQSFLMKFARTLRRSLDKFPSCL